MISAVSGKVDLVQSNLHKVEISGGINLNLKVKWCWCNRPLIHHTRPLSHLSDKFTAGFSTNCGLILASHNFYGWWLA